jgi:hypothetical protein
MSILVTPPPGRKSPSDQIPVGPSTSSAKPAPATWGRAMPGEELTTREHVYEASQQLVAAGLSVIPIEAYEGSKGPDSLRLPHPPDRVSGKPRPSWSIYKMRRPSADELRRWYETTGLFGLAVLGGAVSGGQCGLGLEVIDIDTADVAVPWADAVENRAPGLVNRLVRVRTPRPGLHVYYRCSQFGVSQKLAFAVATDDFGQPSLDVQGKPIHKTMIEVKAEGGYCLIPPSPPRCHPSCRLYQYADGSADLTAVPTISPEERAILLEAARSLSRRQEVKTPHQRPAKTANPGNTDLPGNDFNARGKWAAILIPHGWTFAGEYGDETRWCRPEKNDGVSATTNHYGSDMLHVFTSSAPPFEADGWYTKFSAYTLLNHEGDFKKAASDLREQGYGRKTLKTGKR